MKKTLKVLCIFVALLLCAALAGCQSNSKYRVSDGPPGGRIDSTLYDVYAVDSWGDGMEMGVLAFTGNSNIVVGTVFGRDGAVETVEDWLGYKETSAYVGCFVEIEEVLLGNLKPGDKITVYSTEALYVGSTKTFHPNERQEAVGGFLREGERVLLFLGSERADPDNWFPYTAYPQFLRGLCTRTVDEEGRLMFREGNQYAGNASFGSCSTVEEVREMLPELLEEYRDWYGEDHPNAQKYYASTDAEPDYPEGYVPYDELPEDQKKKSEKSDS